MQNYSYDVRIIPLGASDPNIQQMVGQKEQIVLIDSRQTLERSILQETQPQIEQSRLNNSSINLSSKNNELQKCNKKLPIKLSEYAKKMSMSQHQQNFGFGADESSNKYAGGSQLTSNMQESPHVRDLSPQFNNLQSTMNITEPDANYNHFNNCNVVKNSLGDQSTLSNEQVIISPLDHPRKSQQKINVLHQPSVDQRERSASPSNSGVKLAANAKSGGQNKSLMQPIKQQRRIHEKHISTKYNQTQLQEVVTKTDQGSQVKLSDISRDQINEQQTGLNDIKEEIFSLQNYETSQETASKTAENNNAQLNKLKVNQSSKISSFKQMENSMKIINDALQLQNQIWDVQPSKSKHFKESSISPMRSTGLNKKPKANVNQGNINLALSGYQMNLNDPKASSKSPRGGKQQRVSSKKRNEDLPAGVVRVRQQISGSPGNQLKTNSQRNHFYQAQMYIQKNKGSGQVTHSIMAKIEPVTSPSKVSNMDQSETINTPTACKQNFSEFRLIGNGGDSPQKKSIRLSTQSIQGNRDLLENSMIKDRDLQLEKIIDISEANNSDANFKGNIVNSKGHGAHEEISQNQRHKVKLIQQIIENENRKKHRSGTRSNNQSQQRQKGENFHSQERELQQTSLIDDPMSQFETRAQQLMKSQRNGQQNKNDQIMTKEQIRQHLIDINQLFQDSMMVINSTKMKLNQPKKKDKKQVELPIIKQNQLNQDSTTQQQPDNNQLISVQLINKQMSSFKHLPDSQCTVNVDDQKQETSQSLIFNLSNTNNTPLSEKHITFQNGINVQERIRILQEKYNSQFGGADPNNNDPFRSTQDLTQQKIQQSPGQIKDRKAKNQSNDDFYRTSKYVSSNADAIGDEFDGFVDFLEDQISKIQQHSLYYQAQTKQSFPKSNHHRTFKQYSNSPFKKLRQQYRANLKLAPLDQNDNLLVECQGKQILGITNQQIDSRKKTNQDLWSIPSFQEKDIAGHGQLSPQGNLILSSDNDKIANYQNEKTFFRTNLLELMKKETLTCPQTPISEEEILNVIVQSKDKLPVCTDSQIKNRENHLSSPASNQIEEDEFIPYNHLLKSSLEPSKGHKTKEICLDINQGSQQQPEVDPLGETIKKNANDRQMTSNESKGSSGVPTHSDRTFPQSDNQDAINQQLDKRLILTPEPQSISHGKNGSKLKSQNEQSNIKITNSNHLREQLEPVVNQFVDQTSNINQEMEKTSQAKLGIKNDQPERRQSIKSTVAKIVSRNRNTASDRIESHVQMKLKHLKDMNEQVINNYHVSSANQQDSTKNHAFNSQRNSTFNTEFCNSNNNLVKTKTLEFAASIVGSSTNMEQLDIVGRNIAATQRNQNRHDDDVDTEMRVFSNLNGSRVAHIKQKDGQKDDTLQIARKMNLKPRDIGTSPIDNWLSQGVPQVDIQVKNQMPKRFQNRTIMVTDQSIYLNSHVSGALSSLKKHQPISSFFISKQLKNKKLQEKYSKEQDSAGSQGSMNVRNINFSGPQSNHNDTQLKLMMNSTARQSNFNQIMKEIAEKPNTARNSMLRFAQFKKGMLEDEYPKTAAQTFRFKMPQFTSSHVDNGKNVNENIKLEENFDQDQQHAQQFQMSLEELMKKNSFRYDNIRKVSKKQSRKTKLSCDLSKESTNAPHDQSNTQDVTTEEGNVNTKQNVLHIKNIQLNTAETPSNASFNPNFTFSQQNPNFGKTARPQNASFETSVGKMTTNSLGVSQDSKQQIFQKHTGRKALSPIVINNKQMIKVQDLQSDQQWQNKNGKGVMENDEDGSLVANQRHLYPIEIKKAININKVQQLVNEINQDSVTNIACSQNHPSVPLEKQDAEEQFDKKNKNYSPFGLKFNDGGDFKYKNHLDMLKREIQRKKNSQLQNATSPVTAQLSEERKHEIDNFQRIEDQILEKGDHPSSIHDDKIEKNVKQEDTSNVIIQNPDLHSAQLSQKLNIEELVENKRNELRISIQEQKLDQSVMTNNKRTEMTSLDVGFDESMFLKQESIDNSLFPAGQKSGADKLNNLNQMRSNGYNDFYFYMDTVPYQREKASKQALKDINSLQSKKRHRDYFMQERRRFLLNQVQQALDSTRAERNVPRVDAHTERADLSLLSEQKNSELQYRDHKLQRRDTGGNESVEYPMSLNFSDNRQHELTTSNHDQIKSIRTSNTSEQVKIAQIGKMQNMHKPRVDTNLRDNLIELNDKVTLYQSSKRAQQTPNQALTPFHNSIGGSNIMSESQMSKNHNHENTSAQEQRESDTQVLSNLDNSQ